MASPAEPVTTEPTGALFRALRSVDVEPNPAYEAAEENRRRAGENVVAVLGAKIDAQGGPEPEFASWAAIWRSGFPEALESRARNSRRRL